MSERIRAELTGSRQCSALGITVDTYAPVCALARALIEAGQDGRCFLEVYRGPTLCLRSKLATFARLTVEDGATGKPRFAKYSGEPMERRGTAHQRRRLRSERLEEGLGPKASSTPHSGVFAISGDWALGADSLQWILYRRKSKRTGKWGAVSFVSSTRDILARCMREKGCPPRRYRAAARWAAPDLRGMGRETRSDPCNSGFGRWGRPPCRYARPQRCKRATGSRPGAGAMTPAPKLTPTEKAAKELAQLSDSEWLQVKDAEDRRRADQHRIRDLSRELRNREPAR